jgi:uncharacterized membrane protein
MDSKLKGSLAADRVSVQGAIVFAIVLLAVDQIWLQGAKSLHHSVISRIQKSPPQIRLWPAALFYVFAGVSWHVFLSRGYNLKEIFLFGILMYSTFDLTNLAIFKDYPVGYAIADTLWGGFAIMISALITRKILA